jgi:hypothetical protein
MTHPVRPEPGLMPEHQPQQHARRLIGVDLGEFPQQRESLRRPSAQCAGNAQGCLTSAGDGVQKACFRQQGKFRRASQRGKGGVVVDTGQLRACLIGLVRGLLQGLQDLHPVAIG